MIGWNLEIIALRIPALLIALTVHEFAHARVAFQLGDATAKSYGRMNLNPLSHLDPIGTIMILLVGFGWAKPVPINPGNFTRYRSGLRWVSLAGPLSNLLLGFISMAAFFYLLKAGLAISGTISMFFQVLISLNIMLGIFNLIPLPPLDGSKVLMSFLPARQLTTYYQIEQYAPLILLGLLLIRLPTGTGMSRSILHMIIMPAHDAIFRLYVNLASLLPGL